MLGIMLISNNRIEVTSFGNLTKLITLNDAQNSVLYPGWIITKGYQKKVTFFFQTDDKIKILHKN